MFYFDRIDNIGEYRLKSNKFYKENSGLSEIQPVNLIAAYYLSQQFYYYTCRIKDVLQNPSNQRNFFTLKPGEIIKAIADEEVREELAETEGKIEIAKKVVKQAHDACRSYLPTEEKTLNYRSQVNYCGKCCSQLGT